MEEDRSDWLSTEIVNWSSSFTLAILAGMTTGHLARDRYEFDILHFGRGHGWLSFMGLWLLCYWAVLLTRMLWRKRS